MPAVVRVSTSGGEALQRLGRDLQRAGAVGLRNALVRELQTATKGAKTAVEESARRTLPNSGGKGGGVGLGDWVAELGVVTHVNVTGRNVGVRIVGTMDKSRTQRHRRKVSARNRGVTTRKLPKGILFGEGLADLNAIDRGRVKHPTFAHRPWKVSTVRPGFFTDAMRGPVALAARKACERAIEAMEREIGRRAA